MSSTDQNTEIAFVGRFHNVAQRVSFDRFAASVHVGQTLSTRDRHACCPAWTEIRSLLDVSYMYLDVSDHMH